MTYTGICSSSPIMFARTCSARVFLTQVFARLHIIEFKLGPGLYFYALTVLDICFPAGAPFRDLSGFRV